MHPTRYPSRDEAQRYLLKLQDAQEAVRKRSRPDTDALAWPAGLDRAILVGLPLREGTRRCLLWTGLMEGDNPLTVYEVVRIPNLNLKSMREALVATHAFLSEYIEAFDDRPWPGEVVAMRLQRQVERLTPRESTIIEHRVLRRPPTKLALLGAMLAVSPSRIRYVQARAAARIRIAFGNELPFIARSLTDEIGANADVSTVSRRIDDLFPNGVGQTAAFAKKLFRQAVIDEMGFRLDQAVDYDARAPSDGDKGDEATVQGENAPTPAKDTEVG